MPEVPQRPPKGQAPDIDVTRRRLREFIQAGNALWGAWHPSLDRARNPPYIAWIRDLLLTLELWEEEFAETAKIAAWMVPPLDLGDRHQIRKWLQDLDVQVKDLVAAGEDATRPPGKR